MNVGKGCYIADKWIPKGVSTGLCDIEGSIIFTSDRVEIRGCTSSVGVIGKSDLGFRIFFGSDSGSVEWDLDEETINRHKIKVIKE